MRIFFHPSGAIQEASQFVIRSPSFQVYSFSAVSYHSPILPVLRSSDLYSVRDPLVLMYQDSLKHLHSFANPSRCFFMVYSFFFNSYGGSFKSFLFLHYHINLFVISILPVVHRRPSQVCSISILILSTRISSMSNTQLFINFIGEG